MKITEVRIFPTESKDGKLKAFATMTFDDWFVIRNVKVIQGTSGLFVAMPSRKAVNSCQKCQFKNVIGSKYCNQCGTQLDQQPISDHGGRDAHGGHMDIAHPITQECRVYIQDQILEAYNKETGKGKSEEASHGTEASVESGAMKDQPSAEESKTDESQDTRISGTEDSKDIEL